MVLPVEVVAGRDHIETDKRYATYSPSKITLYGLTLSRLEACLGGTQVPSASVIVNVNPSGAKPKWFTALIYAYAYQGHCYHLPEPTLLTLPFEANPEPAKGFGFDEPNSNFQMWRVEKLDRTMQLEMTSDTFEEILLKRGLQGAKQPLSYATRASISHRGGRLNE